jgi:hypothetical protein
VVSLDTGKRKLLGMDWTGISFGSEPVWSYWLREKSLLLNLITVLIFSQ